MNRFKGSYIFKTLAWIVLTISVIGFGFSVFALIAFEEEGFYSQNLTECMEQEYNSISNALAKKAFWNTMQDEKAYDLTKEGFYYGIVEAPSLEGINLQNKNAYLYSTFTSSGVLSEYQVTELDYSINSSYHTYQDFLYDGCFIYTPSSSEQHLYCNYILYYVPHGLFYYCADGQYYVATNVEIDFGSGFKQLTYSPQMNAYYFSKVSAKTPFTMESFRDQWQELLFDEVRFLSPENIEIVEEEDIELERHIVNVDYCYLNENYTLCIPDQDAVAKHYYVVSYVDDAVKKSTLTMSVNRILANMINTDSVVSRYELASNFIILGYALKYYVIYYVAAFAAFAILSAVFLFCGAGHRKKVEEIVPTFFDRVPLDIFTIMISAIGACVCALLAEVESGVHSRYLVFWIFVYGLTICFLLCFWYLLSIAVRVKQKNLIKNSIIYVVLSWCWKWIKKCFLWLRDFLIASIKHIGTFWVIAGIMLFLTIMDTAAISTHSSGLFCITLMLKLVAYLAVLKILYDMKMLQKAEKRIAEGDIDYQIDTSKMFPDQKQQGENINHIANGLNKAVEERMKSERMKTELITNVSHDIKTPLTSIINYVDLLQKEKIENETVQEYLEVLERQSSRLKKLIEDLVEASKASSGNLAVNVEKIDAGVILSQAVGEFEDKLQKENMELIVKKPETAVEIHADGRHLWRVLDNLMNNICKYGQPHSRVYIDLVEDDTQAQIILRNISKYQLNVSSEELMERFVRGDASRNTEGHGLGLSIAKSLMELMGGKLELWVDGDLFKVILTLKK